MFNTKKLFALLVSIVIVFASMSFAVAEEKVFKIGIAQFAEHGSLDNCRDGFIAGLAEEGFVEGENIEIDFQNGQADMGLCNQIAEQMASADDLICAIATPMAMAAYNAAEIMDKPVIYTAVSDPIASQLANEDGTSENAITGTSDVLPVEAQLKMIRAFMPEAKSIGILYTTSETNSESTLATYKALAPEYGFEIIDEGISVGADIPMALASLLPKVDCLSNLTDNTVVSSLAVVLDLSNEAGKPVFGSEIEQVKAGCAASEGLEYFELGKQTGKIAARVLNGEFAGSIPFEIIEESSLYINSDVLAQLAIEIPAELQDRVIDVLAE